MIYIKAIIFEKVPPTIYAFASSNDESPHKLIQKANKAINPSGKGLGITWQDCGRFEVDSRIRDRAGVIETRWNSEPIYFE